MSFKKIFLVVISFVISLIASAQEMSNASAPIEMAEGLRQSGKIYVVVVVIAIVFTGIVLYLIRLDKKISKLEKEVNN